MNTRRQPQASAKVSHRLSLAASRAYLEVGKADQAAYTLERSELSESRSSTKSVALTLLPYFALLGAMAETEKMFAIGDAGKNVPTGIRKTLLVGAMPGRS